jgi:hypothetical protein
MLQAYSLENHCKARLVGRLSAKELGALGKSHELPSSLRTHDLWSLLASLPMPLTLREEQVVRKMQMCAVWHARYPIPVHANDLRPIAHSNGALYDLRMYQPDDIDIALRLIHGAAGNAT